jgi:hypothetical protein
MVIQAIPNFVMSCFELPLATCEDIQKLTTNIFWVLRKEEKYAPKVLGLVINTESTWRDGFSGSASP